MAAAKAGRIRIGVGGWTYEPWRGTFFPPGLPHRRELEYASGHLTAIEVNGTYYGSQKPATFRKWHDETPEGFILALKAPRFATNRKVLAEAGPSVARFFDSGVMELGDKLGPLNWQFMPTKAFDPADFEAFLKLLPTAVAGRSLRHAVEVRHDSFCCTAFTEMARRYGVAVVIAADGKFPQIADPTAPFIYARIMGTVETEPLGYAPKALDVWAKRAKTWAKGGTPNGLATVGPPAAKVPRDVYLFVISGYKERNPQAAIGIIEQLG